MILKKARYEIDEFTLKVNNESITVDSQRIVSMMITKDFLGKVYPVIVLDVNILLTDYEKIIKEDMMLSTLKMYVKNVDEENDENSALLYNNTLIEDTFYTTISIDTPVKRTVSDIRQEYSEEDYKEQEYRQVKFTLNSKSALGKYKQLVVGNFSGYLTDLIGRSLVQSGITNNVVMSKLDNQSSYSDMIIPGLNLAGTLKYLHETFGLYSYPFYFFMDLNRTYILSTAPDPKATVSVDPKNMVINIIANNAEAKRGYAKESKTITYVIGEKDISFVRRRQTVEETFNSILVSSTANGTTVHTGNLEGSYTGVDYKKHLVSTESNLLYAKALNQGNIINKKNLTVRFLSINSSDLKPNLIYTVNSDTDYNVSGKYRLKRVVEKVQKSGGYLESTVVAEFYKID